MQNTHQLVSRCKTFISSKDIRQTWLHRLDTKRIGGAERDRTADPLLAKQVLSQLSYSPNLMNAADRRVVGLGRFELPTSRLSGGRSNQTEL